jgi:hypothetical protein
MADTAVDGAGWAGGFAGMDSGSQPRPAAPFTEGGAGGGGNVDAAASSGGPDNANTFITETLLKM